MFTLEPSPIPLPDGAEFSPPATGSNTLEDPLNGLEGDEQAATGFPGMLDGSTGADSLEVREPGDDQEQDPAQVAPVAAQNLPVSAQDAVQTGLAANAHGAAVERNEHASTPGGGLDWPMPPRLEAGGPASMEVESLENVRTGLQGNQPAASEAATSGPPVIQPPAVAEVQRIEMAILGQRQSALDARVLLAGTVATTSEGGSPGSGMDSGQGRAPGQAGTIVRSMMTLAGNQGGVVRIRLDPAGLGELKIHMSVQRGVVAFTLEATRTAGAEAVLRGLSSLRAAMESRGLTVDRLSVVGPHGTTDINLADPVHPEETAEQPDREGEDPQQQKQGHSDSRDVDENQSGWFFKDMLELDEQQQANSMHAGEQAP